MAKIVHSSFLALTEGQGVPFCPTEYKTIREGGFGLPSGNNTAYGRLDPPEKLDNRYDRLSDSGCSLEQFMKAYWNVKKMSFGSQTCIDFERGYTQRNYSSGEPDGDDSVYYTELPPKARSCNPEQYLVIYSGYEQTPWEVSGRWAESFHYGYPDEGDISVESIDTGFWLFGNNNYAINPSTGEKKFFHGLSFSYHADEYGIDGYGGSRSVRVTYASRPRFSSSLMADLNRNTHETGIQLEGPDDDYSYADTFRECNQQMVDINGIPFTKTTAWNNSTSNSELITDKIPAPSYSPSITFYDY